MWTHVKHNGYLCAYPSGGFATPLLGQLAEELPLIAPDLSCGYQLVTSWGYLYDDVRSLGIGIHADIARVNINCWITPDDSNLDPQGGGMVIVPARPPRGLARVVPGVQLPKHERSELLGEFLCEIFVFVRAIRLTACFVHRLISTNNPAVGT